MKKAKEVSQSLIGIFFYKIKAIKNGENSLS